MSMQGVKMQRHLVFIVLILNLDYCSCTTTEFGPRLTGRPILRPNILKPSLPPPIQTTTELGPRLTYRPILRPNILKPSLPPPIQSTTEQPNYPLTFYDVLDEAVCGQFDIMLCSTCNISTKPSFKIKPEICYCDAFCMEMGDCCINYFDLCLNITSDIHMHYNETIYQISKNESDFGNPYSKLYFGGFYSCKRLPGVMYEIGAKSGIIKHKVSSLFYSVIDICPKYPAGGNYDNVVLCETINNQSLLQMVPVVYENKLYQNKYCMLCHHEHNSVNVSNFYSLTPFFDCNKALAIDSLKIDADERLVKTCDIYFNLTDLEYLATSRQFHFYCNPDLISKCDPDLEMELTHFDNFDNACQSHAAPIKYNELVYKNKYCALCNNVSISPLEKLNCYMFQPGRDPFSNIFLPPSSFSILLSFTGQPQIRSGYSNICQKEQELLNVVDNECLYFPCTLSEMLVDVDCNGTMLNQSDDTMADTWLIVAVGSNNTFHHKECITKAVNHVVTLYTPCYIMYDSHNDCSDLDLPDGQYTLNISCVRFRASCKNTQHTHTIMSVYLNRNSIQLMDGIDNELHDFCPNQVLFIALNSFNDCNESDSKSLPMHIVADWEVSWPLNYLNTGSGNNIVSIYDAIESVYFMLPELGMLLSPFTRSLNIQIFTQRNSITDQFETQMRAKLCKSSNCFRTSMQEDINGSYLANRCSKALNNTEIPKAYDVKSILTLITVTLSIVSLCALIGIHYFKRSYQKQAKLYVINLTLSLLVAQVLFLASSSAAKYPNLCKTIAIAQHYFWLASFMWSGVLAFSLFQKFKSLRAQNVPDDPRACKLAVLWCGPSSIVLLTFVIETCTDLQIQYGDLEICWIRGSIALGLSFGLPVGLILTLNFIFAVRSVISIKKTRQGVQNMTQSNELSHMKELFVVSIRMSILMGLPWVLGFVSNIKALSFLEYGFIVLNGSQGCLILVSFLSTGEGKNLCKKRNQDQGVNSFNTRASRLSKQM